MVAYKDSNDVVKVGNHSNIIVELARYFGISRKQQIEILKERNSMGYTIEQILFDQKNANLKETCNGHHARYTIDIMIGYHFVVWVSLLTTWAVIKALTLTQTAD